MQIEQVLALARAELRHTLRLVRYWVFLTIACALGMIGYFYYAAIHGFFSSFSGTVAAISPRYLISAVGLQYFLVFLIGAVFLGFDVRARDRRDRILDVLDSRPYTNLELVAGKFLGLFLAVWCPVVLLAAIWALFGLALPAIGSPVGEPVELWSLVSFAFAMTGPGLAFALALVILTTLLVRNRLIAAVLLLAILGADYAATILLPLVYAPLLDLSGAYIVNFPSEIIPAVADTAGWLQRGAVSLAALGLLGLAAAIHPRLDGGSRPTIAAGAGALLVLAFSFAGYGVSVRSRNLERMATWREAHAAHADVPVPDLESISGDVRIDPGRSLSLELDLTFRAPDTAPLTSALFTVNPGLKVIAATARSGEELTFTHEHGLLDLELPGRLEPGAETSLRLDLRGSPDRLFGYLYSARQPESLSLTDGQLFLLGFERAIFDRRFVALMPGIRWLPAAGSERGRDDPRRRGADFFDIDLTVEVPAGWLVAGPGRRRTLPDATPSSGGSVFRFAPPAPVPEVALIASAFESRSVEIDGVLFEVLVHPRHTENLDILAEAGEELRAWLEERLREAREDGLGYPYDGFTLVEVPSLLRGYAGGWRMDTALAPPGLVLMREVGFPTARFDTVFRDPDDFKDYEGGIAQAKLDRVKTHFVNDFCGGNVFVGASRNFVLHQTAAEGPGGLALDFVLETLATRLLTDTRGYFSAHVFDSDIGEAVNGAIQSLFIPSEDHVGDRTIADAVIAAFTSRPKIWDTALAVSLEDLDPWEDPSRTVDVLNLKAGAVARSIFDALGPEKARELLAMLREKHRGTTFSREDVIAAGHAVGENLEELLGDWLGSTRLAGFVVSSARAFRLPDAADGTPRYQLLLVVRNDEPAPGILRVRYWTGAGEERERIDSKPIPLGGECAVEYAAISTQPPEYVIMEPYLSLNRVPFRVRVDGPDREREKIVDEEPLEGVRPVPWERPAEPFIVVDDLDDGFTISEGETSGGLRLGARTEEGETDQGLPLQRFGVPPSRWSRMISSRCYGKYRHTMAAVSAGSGKRKAFFTATVPRDGRWDLELYMTQKTEFYTRSWGTWHLTVDDGTNRREFPFDSGAGAPGWNLVGTVDLPAGEITVELSDRTDGGVVVADAIRWSPSAGEARAADATAREE